MSLVSSVSQTLMVKCEAERNQIAAVKALGEASLKCCIHMCCSVALIEQGREFVLCQRDVCGALVAVGVTDEVAQELQMPIGPQMLDDVEEPMPARPATLRDSGPPDQIVMEQHNLTHFPSQPWCKMCVESRGHDSPHREQSKIDAVVPQLQSDYAYIGDGGPLQIACFLVGADTSSGATHATMVPGSKKMDRTDHRELDQSRNSCVTGERGPTEVYSSVADCG